jgi:hypothetical protein
MKTEEQLIEVTENEWSLTVYVNGCYLRSFDKPQWTRIRLANKFKYKGNLGQRIWRV